MPTVLPPVHWTQQVLLLTTDHPTAVARLAATRHIQHGQQVLVLSPDPADDSPDTTWRPWRGPGLDRTGLADAVLAGTVTGGPFTRVIAPIDPASPDGTSRFIDDMNDLRRLGYGLTLVAPPRTVDMPRAVLAAHVFVAADASLAVTSIEQHPYGQSFTLEVVKSRRAVHGNEHVELL